MNIKILKTNEKKDYNLKIIDDSRRDYISFIGASLSFDIIPNEHWIFK